SLFPACCGTCVLKSRERINDKARPAMVFRLECTHMRGSPVYTFAAGALMALSNLVTTHAQSPTPVCQRLEAQLASLDRGNADPARAEQIRRTEEMVNRQQFEVDRLVAQSRRIGCESSGFFSIFNNPSPQCGGLRRQVDQQRFALERMRNQLEQIKGGAARTYPQSPGIVDRVGGQRMRPAISVCGPRGSAGRFLGSFVWR